MTTTIDPTTVDVSKMTTKDVLAIHNALAASQGGKVLKEWKGKTEKLREKVLALRANEAAKADFDDGDKDYPPTSGKKAVKQPKAAKQPKAKKASAYKAKTTSNLADFDALCAKAIEKATDGKVFTTVRELSEALIRVVVYTNDDKRDVGLPYEAILNQVLEVFGSKTTTACLRWYGVRLRRQPNERIPMIRPRPSVHAGE